MIETARKEDLFLDKKLIIPENRLDAIRIMARLHPVVGDQPTNEKNQPNTNNPVLDLACTILNIHESGVGVHADLRKIQNEPPKYFYGKGFMSGISSLKGNGILAVYGQWRDGTGRYAIKQFYYTDKEILWRNAVSDTVWSAWFDVLTGNSSLDYNKLLNVPITSTLSDSKTQIASIFTVNEVNRKAVTAQKTANEADAKAVAAMNEAKKKLQFIRFLSDEHINNANEIGFYSVASFRYATELNGYPKNGLLQTYVIEVYRWGSSVLLQVLRNSESEFYRRYDLNNPDEITWNYNFNNINTRRDTKGVLHEGTADPKDVLLVGDVGLDSANHYIHDLPIYNYGGRTGFYRSQNGDLYPVTSNCNIIYHGYSNERMSGILQSPISNDFWMFNSYTRTFAKGYTTDNTTNDPSGFLRSFGNAVALTTDKLTSDLKVNRSDLVASAKYAYDVYQAALAADKKAVNAQTTANTGVANAKTAQARADAAFSRIKPITEGGTGATTVANARKNLGIDDIPVDQVFIFESATPPPGYIARNGQIINESTMPKLYAKYGSSMPDDRNRVHRMQGNLTGSVGSTQEDAIRNITASFYYQKTMGNVSANGAFNYIEGPNTGNSGYVAGHAPNANTINFDASRVVPTASENRVKSRIVIFCNKIQ